MSKKTWREDVYSWQQKPFPKPADVRGSLLAAEGTSGPTPSLCKKVMLEHVQLITAHRRRKGQNDGVCEAAAHA